MYSIITYIISRIEYYSCAIGVWRSISQRILMRIYYQSKNTEARKNFLGVQYAAREQLSWEEMGQYYTVHWTHKKSNRSWLCLLAISPTSSELQTFAGKTSVCRAHHTISLVGRMVNKLLRQEQVRRSHRGQLLIWLKNDLQCQFS